MRIPAIRRVTVLLVAYSIVGVLLVSAGPQQDPALSIESHDWPVWGGGAENLHYSPLAQVNRGNVNQLQLAWRFNTEEQGGLQTSPIIVHGRAVRANTYTESLCIGGCNREAFVEIRLRN